MAKIKVCMEILLDVNDTTNPIDTAKEFIHAMINGEDGFWFYFKDDVSIGKEPVVEYELLDTGVCMGVHMKDLKRGDFFTLRPISEPRESQVYIRGEYDRSERKYWAQKWCDISAGRYLKGDTIVYTEFTF